MQDRVRLDRLESDAKSLGDCLAEQFVLPWTIYNWGDPKIAPGVRWSTKAPEDRAKLATTYRDAGTALGLLLKGGLNVDRIEYAKQFNIKLNSKQPLLEPQLGGLGDHEPEEDAEPDEGDDEEPDEGTET